MNWRLVISKRFIQTILLAFIASTNCAAAEYLLRLETKLLNELRNEDFETAAKTAETVEILVRLGESFYGSTCIGTDRVIIRGRLEVANDGTPGVQMFYRKVTASSGANPAIRDDQIPKSTVMELKTDVIPMILGKPIEYDTYVTVTQRIKRVLSIIELDLSHIPDLSQKSEIDTHH